jgi:hypothetical protein
LSGVTEDQFKTFSEDSQSNIIDKRGVLIGTRRTKEYKVLLYQIDSFYVEVFYHPGHHFIRIESFAGTEKLSPYLNKISIENLV